MTEVTPQRLKALRDRAYRCRKALSDHVINNPRFCPEVALGLAQDLVDAGLLLNTEQAEYDAAQPKYREVPAPPDMTLDKYKNRATNRGLGR